MENIINLLIVNVIVFAVAAIALAILLYMYLKVRKNENHYKNLYIEKCKEDENETKSINEMREIV